MEDKLSGVPILKQHSIETINNKDDLTICHDTVLPGQELVERDIKPSVILEEFKDVYEECLAGFARTESEDDKEMKIKLLSSWVNDLSEQNAIVIQTVEQVEQEAADRVSLLEDRLQKSSRIAAEYLSKFQNCSKCREINDKVKGMHTRNLKMDIATRQHDQAEEILKKRICNLQNDISGLLEIIRRARCYGSWDASGLSFLELTYEDIFG